MFEPGTVVDRDHYDFSYFQPIAIDENEDEYAEDFFDSIEGIESFFDATGIDFDEVNELLLLGNRGSVVMTAEFDKEEVIEELDDENIDDDEDIEGFEGYFNDETTFGVAIDNDTILLARQQGEEDAEEIIEVLVETNNDSEDRYSEESDAFAVLADHLGQSTFVSGYTHESTAGAPASPDISYGQTVNGSLTRSSQRGYRGYYESHRFGANEGDNVRITMNSDTGDTYLLLLGPDGQEVARDDDGGTNFNSQISMTMPETGQYEIIATSFDSGATFDYTLDLEGASTSSSGFEEEVARGVAIDVDEDEANYQTVLVFEDDGGVDTDDIQDRTDEAAMFEEVDDIEVEQDGRAALITGTIDTDDVTLQAFPN